MLTVGLRRRLPAFLHAGSCGELNPNGARPFLFGARDRLLCTTEVKRCGVNFAQSATVVNGAGQFYFSSHSYADDTLWNMIQILVFR
jgi:hypothetical protein